MYQIILHGQVPAARYNRVLSILSKLAVMDPAGLNEHMLIYRQLKPREVSKKTATQSSLAPKLHYHKLRRHTTNPDLYTLVIEETPQAGVKDVNVRKVSEQPQVDLSRFRKGSEWYRFEGQCLINGHVVVYGNIVIRIYRMFLPPKVLEGEAFEAPMPTAAGSEIVDKSGAGILEAFVKTEDGVGQEVLEASKTEFLNFAKLVGSEVPLFAIERLAMDTDVKGD